MGIVAYHYLGNFIVTPWLWVALLVMGYLWLRKNGSYHTQYWLSGFALLILFLFGYLRLQNHRLDNQQDHLLYQSKIEAYKAVVSKAPAIKARSVNVKLDVSEVRVDGKWNQASGRVNAYVSQAKGGDVRYGDVLVVSGAPGLTTAPANPGEFDFRNYLVYNNIFHQQFIGEKFEVIGNVPPSKWVAMSLQMSGFCRDRLQQSIKDPNARAVILALVLGVKDELNPEIQGAFAASGAMHVLAVSGLHVGIIYGLVLLVFNRVRRRSVAINWTKALISIAVLWCYAFLTGLSPSVLRAVTMFSFMALSNAMNRNGNIYNTLAVSAFVLLCYNPYLIMSVGFQLSYIAVFGIVYLQPRFYNLLTIRNGLLDKVWAITCVSLAAQIATAPLSILYFHQFPTYFLLSNLFIIPAAFVMLIMGLAVLATSGIPGLGDALSWLTEQFVSLVNQLVFKVQGLPGSTLEGIRLNILETWLIYAVIIYLITLFQKKRFKYLCYAVACSGIFAINQLLEQRQYTQSGTFRVLDVSRTSAYDFRYGKVSRLLADSSFLSNQDRLRFHFEPGRLQTGSNLRPTEDDLELIVRPFAGNEVVTFCGETFLILKEGTQKLDLKEQLAVDHLILKENAIRDLGQLKDKFQFKNLLIDPSNSQYVAKKLINQAEALDLNVHSVTADGYFEKRWEE